MNNELNGGSSRGNSSSDEATHNNININNNDDDNDDGYVFTVKQDEVHFVDKPSQNLLCPVCQERKLSVNIPDINTTNHFLYQS